eukprot:NODE_444_length_8544_cov_0.465127.p8 type:complete len:101 gc:universal NODE_444_length_8544_cov_0.465127:2859-3161(+)
MFVNSTLYKKMKWTKIKTFSRLHKGALVKKDDDIIDSSKLISKFIKGSGPGGQCVNKSSNCVQLIYGDIQVKCHSTRSKDSNLIIAKQLLREKLQAKEKQ